MKRLLHCKQAWLALAAMVLVLSIGVGSTMAYFTTYAEAKGGYVLKLSHDTGIKEEFSNWTKHVTVTNTGSVDCFVRIRAFCGAEVELEYADLTDSWTIGEDGYIYYNYMLPAGFDSAPIDIKINLPADFKSDFNVIVIQESTPALFDENGMPYADWDMVLDRTDDFYEHEAGEGGTNP